MVWILSSIETASSKRLASIFQNGKCRKSRRRRRRQPDITTIGENTQSEYCLTKIAGYYYHSEPNTLYMKQICSIQSIPNPAKTETSGTQTVVEYFARRRLFVSA